MGTVKVETLHTIVLPPYPPPAAESNYGYGQQEQRIYVSTALARELLDKLTAILGGAT